MRQQGNINQGPELACTVAEDERAGRGKCQTEKSTHDCGWRGMMSMAGISWSLEGRRAGQEPHYTGLAAMLEFGASTHRFFFLFFFFFGATGI